MYFNALDHTRARACALLRALVYTHCTNTYVPYMRYMYTVVHVPCTTYHPYNRALCAPHAVTAFTCAHVRRRRHRATALGTMSLLPAACPCCCCVAAAACHGARTQWHPLWKWNVHLRGVVIHAHAIYAQRLYTRNATIAHGGCHDG